MDAVSHPVVGSDDDRAKRKAASFPHGARISCVRHLRNNVADYLRDTVGIDAEQRKEILEPLFGQDGVTSAENETVFESLMYEARQQANKFAVYSDYFEGRLEPMFQENFATSQLPGFQQRLKKWTNNNCERLNHILKQAIHWQPQALGNLIDKLREVVCGQYIELERSLFGVGDYQFCSKFRQFRVHDVVWMRMTNEQREKHLSRFMLYKARPGRRTTWWREARLRCPPGCSGRLNRQVVASSRSSQSPTWKTTFPATLMLDNIVQTGPQQVWVTIAGLHGPVEPLLWIACYLLIRSNTGSQFCGRSDTGSQFCGRSDTGSQFCGRSDTGSQFCGRSDTGSQFCGRSDTGSQFCGRSDTGSQFCGRSDTGSQFCGRSDTGSQFCGRSDTGSQFCGGSDTGSQFCGRSDTGSQFCGGNDTR
uniref:MULE transposase domain-containing protein n=1 Tax=Branchiostoma floridae TaxID=7739 RepID=C3ZYJ6_BRAFL|eukprot:XP_002586369.1 hypothetical protein BRAFLDRAFT_108654 [Branchiostoma floridae]